MADSIESRLIDWGSWARGYSRGGTSSQPWVKAIAMGCIPQASPDNWSVFPPEIEQTERAIAQLRLKHPYLKKLIFFRYLYGNQPEEIATILNSNKEAIERGLAKGRDWIGDYLEALEIPDESVISKV